MKTGFRNFILTTTFILSCLSLSAQKEINYYDIDAVFERGVMLYENKNYGSALECFEEYISKADDKNSQDFIMAKYYEATASLLLDKSKGENKVITFVKEHPTNLLSNHANFLYANTLFNNKKYRDALERYEEVKTENLSEEEQDECNFKTALSYFQIQEIENATDIFKNLTKKDNEYRDDAMYYYAHILYSEGKTDEAYEYFIRLQDDKTYGDVSDTYILQILFDRGEYAEITKRGDAVIEKAQKARKTDIALMMAESWFQLKDYSKSLEYYEMARQNTRRDMPRDIDFKIGFCKMKAQDYEGAIEHLQDVSEGDDELAQYGSYYLAQCYTNSEQEKFARNTFLKAYKMKYNDTLSENALFNYAALSFIPGIDPFNEAVTVLNDFIKYNEHSPYLTDIQETVIHLLLNSKDYDGALDCIEQYPRLSPELEKIQARLTYNVGIQHYNERNYDEAITFFKRSSNSRNIEASVQSEALYWMADAYYQKKDNKNALRYYLQFLQTPAAKDCDVYPLAYYNMGYIYLNNADFNNAMQKFKEFNNYDKSSDKDRQSDSWMRIGDSYFIMRQYNNAINAYGNATKLSSRNTDYALYQQGMGYGALGKTKEKINCLNIIGSRYPKSSFYDKALYEIGMANLSTNDNRAAIASFDRVVKERPRSMYARLALMKTGMIYYNNDEYDQALTRLKNVVTQYPNTDESREALNIISNIYRDKNEIQNYFDYLEENNLATISVDEQDSLTFRTIEDFYSRGKYDEAIKGAKQYIEKYNKGAYLLDVHYFAMKSMENKNNYDGIKTHINYIIGQVDNDYTDNALLLIARIDYDSSNYEAAAGYYERLINITENQQMLLESTEGCMKANYFNKNYDKAIEKANLLVEMVEATDTQKNQAEYILGKSYFDKKNYAEAMKHLDLCSDKDKTETGAECAYYSALCLYNMQKYNEAEEKIFNISDNYNSYIGWTARSFIVLSDVYVALDNTFQAKETLKSVIENYPKDAIDNKEVTDMAKEKLNILEKEVNE